MSALMALISAIVGVLPLLVFGGQKRGYAVPIAICGFFISWLIYWAGLPSMVWPLWGGVGAVIFVLWIIGAAVYSMSEEEFTHAWWFPIIAAVIYLFVAISGSGLFRSQDYAKLIGQVEEREWTQDVQPKDPAHIRLVPRDLAEWLADKQLGEVKGAIGSQFNVSKKHMTLQLIKGELWYVAPLDFNGFTSWTSADVSPGYVMVNAEDPLQPVIVKSDQKFSYMPNAYWGHYLDRYLWSHGYMSKGLTDYSFEIDESGQPWWVVTVFEPTISWWGKKVTGVVVVNPTDGNITFHALGSIPNWIDRAVPASFVTDYITNWGMYSGGWWNSVWGKKNIIEGEDPTLNYGSNGEPYWVATLTSSNTNDEALIGLVYYDSRTAKVVKYHAIGGTEAAVLMAVNNKVIYQHWHGTDPVLYNIYGTMASIVPILGENHTFQGVAITKMDNLQVAVGQDQYVALREYQKLLSLSGQQIAAELAYTHTSITGIVDRFADEIKGTEMIYYIHLRGGDRLFTGMSELSPKLPVSKEGDSVKLTYIDSPEDVVPLVGFDNLSLPLVASPAQDSLRHRVSERQQDTQTHEDVRTLRDKLNNMSDEQVKKLLEQQTK